MWILWESVACRYGLLTLSANMYAGMVSRRERGVPVTKHIMIIAKEITMEMETRPFLRLRALWLSGCAGIRWYLPLLLPLLLQLVISCWLVGGRERREMEGGGYNKDVGGGATSS